MNTEKMPARSALSTAYAGGRSLAPGVVRVGIALVILWFGTQQLTDTNAWVRLIPTWATAISGLEAPMIVTMNGIAELIIGTMLLFGFFTRIVALLSALHLFLITFIVGYGPIGVRDFGLAMAATSTFLYGVDKLSLDAYLAKRKTIQTSTV